MSVRDDEHKLLGDQGYTGSYNDRINASLEASTSTTGQNNDLWKRKFDGEAVGNGQHNNRLLTYLQSLGATATNVNQAYKELVDLGIAPSLPSTPPSNPILDTDHPDLVAMFTMDNISGATLVDESPNSNDGTITGATPVTGVIDNALDFDGVNDVVALPHAPFVLSQGALSAWVKIDASNNSTLAFTVSSSFSTSDYVQLSAVDWYTSPGDYRIALVVDPGGVAAEQRNFYGSTSLSAGVWYHLVWQSNGSELELYVDGVKETVTERDAKTNGGQFLASAPTNQADISLLRRNLPAYRPGTFDQWRMFNRALTQDEISALYLEGTSQILSTTNPNLTAMYTMDNITGSTLNDESPNSKNLTISGAVQTTGIISNALSFDGVDDYVSSGLIGQGRNISEPHSISMWAKWSEVGTTGMGLFYLRDHTGNSVGVGSAIVYNGNSTSGSLILRSGSGDVAATSITNVWNDGEWHHIAAVFDVSTMQLYIDGVPQNAGTRGTFTTTQTADFIIGANHDGVGDYHRNAEADIDQFRIFNRAINNGEIQQLYQEGAGEITSLTHPSRLATWTMDDVAGTTLQDATPKGVNLTLVNNPSFVPGVIGNAIQGNGTSSYATGGASEVAALTGSQGCVAYWVNCDDIGAIGVAGLSMGSTAVGNLFMAASSTGNTRPNLTMNRTDLPTTSTRNYIMPNVDYSLLTGWHLVAYQNDGTGLQGFFDGVEQTLSELSGKTFENVWFDNPDGWTTVDICRIGRNTPLYYDSSLDHIAVFNRALTQAEHATLYQEGI